MGEFKAEIKLQSRGVGSLSGEHLGFVGQGSVNQL